MRASRKFPPFPTAESQHQHRTLQRRRIGHFKHHTERHRKHQKRNISHLQSQWTTYHHRSQQADHQFLRRHFQPEQKHHTTIRPPREHHPPTATTNIHDGINKRLSSITSDKVSFDQAAPPYQKALDECGYQFTLHYEPPTSNKRKNRQHNNIVWYNHPFSKNVSTNIEHINKALMRNN